MWPATTWWRRAWCSPRTARCWTWTACVRRPRPPVPGYCWTSARRPVGCRCTWTGRTGWARWDWAAGREPWVARAASLLDGLGLPAQGSAIVSLDIPEAAQRLADAGVRASSRAGRARLAFHLYNTTEDVDLALDALA